jgi:hypothetical protein
MSLGLAVSDGTRIFLAIESKGVPVPCGFLDSKLWLFPEDPPLILIVRGELCPWAKVRNHLSAAKDWSVQASADEIAKTLDACMIGDYAAWESFGLLCGHDNGKPKCYRIDRLGYVKATVKEENFEHSVQPIGASPYAGSARQWTEAAIKSGMDRLDAIRRGINDQILEDEKLPPDKRQLRGPISLTI